MTTMIQIQNLSQEYQNFKSIYGYAGNSLSQVIAIGTTLYNDPTFAQMFPKSIAAYQAYLLSLQQAINTFIASLPVEPQLNG